MEKEIRELNREIRELNREIRELKEDTRERNREMKGLKADIREMKAYMKRLSRRASARTSLDHGIKKSEEVEFQLAFANKLPDKIFTKDKIRDESGEPLQIKLINTISGEIVVEGPHSSIETQIVVTDSGFGFEENKSWTENEFIANIVRQREGKGPLVKGKQKIKLRDGVGTIDDISFNDNSSWATKGMFRLGARVLQRSCMGQVRIKEAISEAFAVRDYRMRDYPVKRSKKLNNLREVVSCMADDERRNAAQIVHKGSAGMQKDSNHVPSSHKIGFSTSEEIVPNIGPQPVAKYTCNPANAQGAASNGIFHHQNSSQLNEHHYLPSLNIQAEVGTYNNPTTDLLFNQYQGIQIVPSPRNTSCTIGMQNDNNHVLSSDEIGFSTSEDIVLNLAQPLDMSTCNPVNAPAAPSNVIFNPQTNGDSGSGSHPPLRNSSPWNNHFMTESCQPYNNPTTGPAGMQNEYCNHAMITTPSHVNDQLTLRNDDHQPQNNGDLGWNSPQLNELDFFKLSANTQLMIGSSPNNHGPLAHFSASQNNQNTVISTGRGEIREGARGAMASPTKEIDTCIYFT